MTPSEVEQYKRNWLMSKCYTVQVHNDREMTCVDWCKANLNRWEWEMSTNMRLRTNKFFFEKKEHADAFEKEFL